MMKRRIVKIVAVVAAALALTGCSAGASSGDVLQTPEQRYLKDVYASNVIDLNSGMDRATLDQHVIKTGYLFCTSIGQPGVTRDALINSTELSRQAIARAVIGSAERNLCPDKRFAPFTAPVASTPAWTPQQPPLPAGTYGEGTYEVGSDIPPGKYRTNGASHCYWARLKNTEGGFGSIIANGNTNGPATVTIAPSDGAFQISGDCLFVKK